MEAPLLTATGTEKKHGGGEETLVRSEVKKQLYLAGPLIAGHLMMTGVHVVSLVFVGHLGRVEFAGASVATAFANVTGLCLLGGMASALATLCGQAFGARQHHLVGVYKQRAMQVLALVSIPVAVVCAYVGEIIARCGLDPDIAASAGSYARWLIPSILVFGQLQCHIQFLQTQNVVMPVMVSSCVAAVAHPAVCWLLACRLGLGSRGVALSIAVAHSVNLSILAVYIRMAPSCKDTWAGFSGEAFRGIPSFLKLALPSALMICMEWWSFQFLVLIAGLLPNPKLETSVTSICLHTINLAVMVPIGLGAAISTRVSNELGARHPEAARLATRAVMFLAISVCVCEGLVMVLARNLLGYAYSNDEEVAKSTARVMPVLVAALLFHGLQSVLSGIIRGCGRQKLGVIINFVSYYIAGIPAALLLAFACHLGAMGLWSGLLCGLVVQVLLLLSVALCTNWEEEVLNANGRVFISSKIPADTSI